MDSYFPGDSKLVNCPICKNKMPYGLDIHMAAAHDPGIAKHLRAAQAGNETSLSGGKRHRAKRKQGKSFGKKSPKPLRRPKHF